MNRHLTGPRRYAELGGAGANTETSAPPTTYNTATTSAFPNQTQQSQNASYQTNQTASPFNPSYSEPQYAANSYPQSNGSYSEASSTASTSGYNTAKTATTPVSDMKARRKSSKSKQIDTDKIPRPDILAETSYAPPEYVTSSYLNPPASFSNYITVDDGNAGPRYVRSSFYRVPVEESLVKSTDVPLGLIIQPLADPSPEEEAVPIIDSGEEGPLRCNRCRAYVSPHWLFVKSGSYGVCNLCKMSNEIPKEYYSPLDAAGLRCDRLERPELSKGVYEFLAPQAYHVRPLVTPNILFCIEASSASYLSGVFHQIFSSLQSLLDYIPSPELTKICIVTYDTGVNFFKVPDDLTKEISITHVSDVDSPCLPYPKSYYFLSLQDERDKINYLIERIIKHYESSEKIQKGVFGTCFGAAVVDCCDILLKDGGRVLAFTTQAPIAGLGKIKKREDYKLHGTDKEKTLYVPQVEDYNTWAKRALEKRVCIDLFCFAPEYFDVVTIGNLCGLTGGNFYYYPTYKPTADGERLHYDLARNLTRYVGYDAVMTIRTPQGISFMNYLTPSGRKPEAELEFAALDSDTAINAFFKHDEKLTDDNVSFQVAVLYSNPYGQRVIRVINFKALTSNDLVAIFRACDVEAVAQLTIKKHISTITSLSVPQIKKALLDNLVNILYNYRQHCASGSSPSQLILPEALKVLPMYVLSTFKSFILRTGGEVKSDDRAYDLFRFMKAPLNVLSTYLYPKVYPLHTIWTEDEFAPGNVVNNRVVLPANVAATDEKIDDNGIYLIDNAEFLFLYIKKGVDPAFLPHLIGVETYQEAAQVTSFPDYIESEYFTKVSSIIDQLRKNKNASYQPVRIVTEKDQSEQAALNCLCEDERLGESYSVFLCNVHKLIHNKYS